MVLAFPFMLSCRVLWKQYCTLTAAQHGVEKAIWDSHIGQHSGVQCARLNFGFLLFDDTLPWCRLGNKAFSYSLPIQPRRALVQPDSFSTPGIHSGVYAVELSRTQCRLCRKALADLFLKVSGCKGMPWHMSGTWSLSLPISWQRTCCQMMYCLLLLIRSA